jgi:hypothetical protein
MNAAKIREMNYVEKEYFGYRHLSVDWAEVATLRSKSVL